VWTEYLVNSTPHSQASLQALFRIMDPLSVLAIASSAAQFLEQTAKVVQGLYDYCQTVSEAPQRSRELQREVTQVSDVLMDLQSVLKSIPNNVQLPRTIKSLSESSSEFTEVMKEMASRMEVQPRDIGKRLKWPFDEKQNKKYLAKVETFKKTATLALNIVQLYVCMFLRFIFLDTYRKA